MIEYLRSKYEKDTGMKVAMPQSLGTLLGDDSIVAEQKKEETEEEKKQKQTFGEAVENLRLPRGEPPAKG